MQDDQASTRPSGPLPLRIKLARAIALVVLLPGALACFYGAWLLVARDGAHLVDDSWAFLGGGTAEGVPVVSSVHCVRRSAGGGSRSAQASDWACVIDLAPRQVPVAAPRPGASAMEVVEDNLRRLAELHRPDRRGSARLERVLASNRTGEIPTLRRLSREGEAPRHGIVWGAWELAGRWFFTTYMAVFLVAVGGGLLFIVWLAWTRSPASAVVRRPGPP